MNTYFAAYPGKYFTGDGARRDADGYYWITGRVDDVINVSGHRMGTAEVESALVAHPKVSEAGVVGYPHDIKGQGIYAYVTLMAGVEANEDLRKELVAWVRKEIGPIASPDLVQFAPISRPARARSCAGLFARSQRTSMVRWATPQRSPIQPWSAISSTKGRTAARITGARVILRSGNLMAVGSQDATSNSWAVSILVADDRLGSALDAELL